MRVCLMKSVRAHGSPLHMLKDWNPAKKDLLEISRRSPTEGRRLLAASYGHLGLITEAREQVAKVLEAHPNFSLDHWVSIQPDKYYEDVEHFVDGLKKAGL